MIFRNEETKNTKRYTDYICARTDINFKKTM
jgi:hypothetical protein